MYKVVRPIYVDPGWNRVGICKGGEVLDATDKNGSIALWVESPVGDGELVPLRVLVMEQKEEHEKPDGVLFIAMVCSRGLWYAVYVDQEQEGD